MNELNEKMRDYMKEAKRVPGVTWENSNCKYRAAKEGRERRQVVGREPGWSDRKVSRGEW